MQGGDILTAVSALKRFLLPTACRMTLAEAAPLVEIRGGTKKKHFANLKEKTGIPYNEMVFFVRTKLCHPQALLSRASAASLPCA